MMKFRIMFFIATVCLASLAVAQEQTEEQCAKNVDGFLQGMSLLSEQSGSEKKFRGLSVDDIKRMQVEKGSCATNRMIIDQLSQNK